MELTVPDISCGHCVGAVTKAIRELDAAARVEIDIPSKRVTVASSASREAIVARLAEAGYPVMQ